MSTTRLGTALMVVVACTLSAALGAGAARGQAPSRTAEKVDEETVEREGRRGLREAYFELRRLKPDDPAFDAASARFAAISSRVAAEEQLSRTEAPLALPTFPWQSFGPQPINFGQTPTSAPRYPSDVSGRTIAIAIDASDGEVYIGGAQGGVWKSTDNGASWTPLTDQLNSLAVDTIALDPADNDVMYLGTGEGNGSCDSYGGVGVYKSTDGGASWSGPFGSAQFTNRGITSIVVDRNNSQHLLLTTASGIFGVGCTAGPTLPDRGVFESTDGGSTWTKRTTANKRASRLLQDPFTATTWWAAMWYTGLDTTDTQDGGLLKSTDNGTNWAQIAGTGGLPVRGSAWGRAWITGTPNSGAPTASVLYLGSADSGGRVYKSTDSGVNWTQLTAANGYCNPQCFYDMPIHVEAGDPSNFYTGGAGASGGSLPTQFMRSTDGGTTFSDKVRSADLTNALHADVHEITTYPGQPNHLWTTNDGGVWRSLDRGDNWINVNSNLGLTQFTGCDLHPTNPHRAYGGSQDNGTEGSLGTVNWKHLDFGDGGFARIDQGNPNNLVHTYFNQQSNLIGVGFTTGGFATTMGSYLGSFASGNGISISDRVLFYAPIHLDRGRSDTLYFGTHKLYRANNFFVTGGTGGEFAVLAGGADLSPSSGALSAIETFKNPTPNTNADLLYTGSSTGAVHRSTNAGTTFTRTDCNVGCTANNSNLFVSDILVHPNDSNLVIQSRSGFAGAAGQNIRRSTDGGNNWVASGSGIPDIPVNALAIDPVDSNRIWAGTDAGAFVSEDLGVNWVPYNTGLPRVAIHDLDSNPATGRLLACTHGRSAWVLTFKLQADGFESGNTEYWSAGVP